MKYWLLLFCNLFSLSVLAENVPLTDARNWAISFFQNQVGTRAGSLKLNMVWDGEEVNTRSESHPAFYVFNREDQDGFVIVSGEDLVNPLIGYSFDHGFQTEEMPEHIYSWLMNRKAEINYIRQNKQVALGGMEYQWNNASANIGKVLKKIETAQWNQGAPYNKKCPVDESTGRTSVTGCVATAYAIALRAREWPDAGMGVVPSYKFDNAQGTKVVIPEHNLGHTYNWDKMPLKNISSSSSEDAIEEVSTLMADCGKMVKATYSSQATGAFIFNVAKSLREYMKYSPNLDYETREYYSTTTWNAMIQNEINEYGPVIYGGVSTGGGHAFVLDGYTDKNYYSVNWGWGGVANGYFVLSLLNPDSQGIGGSHSEDGFNIMQDAIFTMRKAEPNEIVEKYPNYNLISFLYRSAETYFYGLVPSTNRIKQGEKFLIDRVSLANVSYRGIYPLELTISVFDKKNQHKESVSEVLESEDLDEGRIQIVSDVECLINGAVEEGDYLAVAYRPKGCTAWKEMSGGHQTQTRIPLLNGNFATAQDVLVLSSGDRYDDVYWGIKSSRKVIRINREFFIKTGYVCNTAFEPFSGKISAGHFDKEGNLKKRVTKKQITVMPVLKVGQCAEYTIQSCKVTSEIEEGDYIALCYQNEGSEEWKLIPPLTGVTGRIDLEALPEEQLDEETSFRYIKKDRVINLKTLEDATFDLQDAEGTSVKSGITYTGTIALDVSKLNGSYKLRLTFGEQTKTIQIIL